MWHTYQLIISFLLFWLCGSFTAGAQSFRQSAVGMSLSNLHIQSIAQDSLGYIWLATARGLNRLDGYAQTFYFKNSIDTTSLANDNILKLFVSSSGELKVFTRGGLNIYDRVNNRFKRLKENSSILDDSFTVEEDLHGVLWLGTRNGLLYVDCYDRICPVELPRLQQPIEDICRDDQGNLWLVLGKDRTVVVFNPSTLQLVTEVNHFSSVKRFFRGPQKNTLYGLASTSVILIDIQSGERIGESVYRGEWDIEKANITVDRKLYFLTSDLQLHIYDSESNSFAVKAIRGINSVYNITSVFVDKQSNVWIGTFEEGYKFIPFVKYDFNADALLGEHFNNKFVTFLTGDTKEHIWVATRHEGLQEFDRKTGKVSMLLNMRLQNEEAAISCCFYDSKQRLWVATVDAVYCYRTVPERAKVKQCAVQGVRYITEDSEGNIWMICNGHRGIWMVSGKSDLIELTNPFTFLSSSPNITYMMQLRSGDYLFSSFGDNIYQADIGGKYTPLFVGGDVDIAFLKSIIYIYEDSRGVLWLGTYGCGLMSYDLASGQKKLYTMREGLPSNDVLSITEDAYGNLWLSTSFGLSKMAGNNFVNYFSQDGLLGNQYHERSVYTEHGILYFTGNHGITSFRPGTIQPIFERVPLLIENLVSDKKTYTFPVRQPETLYLSYKERSFTVSFLGFDYSAAKNLQYSYRLEGYDKDWSVPSTSRTVKFSNIPPGRYHLRVKVCDNEGQWNDNMAELNIVLPPAPWATWWAILLYIIFAVAFLLWMLRFYINYKIDKEKIKISEETLQKERELNQAKINFFENVSHELRTPLGLIYGPFCELERTKGFSKEENKYMNLIGANIERLMALVEQILNFSHLNSETLSLAVDRQDLVALVWKVMRRFQGENREKHIETSFASTEQYLEMCIDEDKVDKILSNLLSNAFKYTPAGGKIAVSLRLLSDAEVKTDYNPPEIVASAYVQLSVKDSGIGVAKEELERIFDRFYRSKNHDSASVGGSGIGLYYIKCLTLKHKGFIKAERNLYKGMTFRFCLPLDYAYDVSEMKTKEPAGWKEAEKPTGFFADASLTGKEESEEPTGNEPEEKEKPQLLIVEDEPSLQCFLEALLKPSFHIRKAFDGEEGLKLAMELIPDIILTDVMMPRLNGYQLCQEIKNDARTCHIPVIMLTAKCNVNEQIEGVNAGADVYIPKPFNPGYLLSVLQGVIRNRRRVQHIIVGQGPGAVDGGSKDTQDHLSSMDKELLWKPNEKMEAELANPELSIDTLSAELNFSRSTFYRKIKSLTGFSPNDYIRVYKIRRAAELIESTSYTLAEIGDMTGFSTQSYFSAMFKKHFGMTPTEYRNSPRQLN